MPDVSIKIDGIEKLQKAFDKAPREADKMLTEVVRTGAEILRRGAIKAITTGTTRAIDTSRLRNSIRIFTRTRFKSNISTNVNYAPFVHEGTSRMRKRPFMTRGIKLSKKSVEKFFNFAVKKMLTKLKI